MGAGSAAMTLFIGLANNAPWNSNFIRSVLLKYRAVSYTTDSKFDLWGRVGVTPASDRKHQCQMLKKILALALALAHANSGVTHNSLGVQ